MEHLFEMLHQHRQRIMEIKWKKFLNEKDFSQMLVNDQRRFHWKDSHFFSLLRKSWMFSLVSCRCCFLLISWTGLFVLFFLQDGFYRHALILLRLFFFVYASNKSFFKHSRLIDLCWTISIISYFIHSSCSIRIDLSIQNIENIISKYSLSETTTYAFS